LSKPIDTKTALAQVESLLSIPSQRDPYKRFTILAYQLANVGRSLRYMRVFPTDKSSYEASLRADLGDLLIQTITLIKLYNFDLSDILKLGADRLEEFKLKEGFKDD